MSEPDLLLCNMRQARKVRIVAWGALIIAILALWGGWVIFQTYGLSEGDGGVLKPFGERLAFGLFVAVLGSAFGGGMLLYMSLYALRIERSDEGVTLDTMTLFGSRRRRIPLSEIGESAYYHGRLHHVTDNGSSGGLWVNAPWITLRVRGRRLPFVIDLQADEIDIPALTVLAEGAVGDWRDDVTNPS